MRGIAATYEKLAQWLEEHARKRRGIRNRNFGFDPEATEGRAVSVQCSASRRAGKEIVRKPWTIRANGIIGDTDAAQPLRGIR